MGILRLENLSFKKNVIYLSIFYCLFYVKDISTDILEEQLLEEIDPDLNEKEDIRM